MATPTHITIMPLSKREYFAMAAMQGLCSVFETVSLFPLRRAAIAKYSVEMADELIARLDATAPTESDDDSTVTDESGAEDRIHRMD